MQCCDVGCELFRSREIQPRQKIEQQVHATESIVSKSALDDSACLREQVSGQVVVVAEGSARRRNARLAGSLQPFERNLASNNEPVQFVKNRVLVL